MVRRSNDRKQARDSRSCDNLNDEDDVLHYDNSPVVIPAYAKISLEKLRPKRTAASLGRALHHQTDYRHHHYQQQQSCDQNSSPYRDQRYMFYPKPTSNSYGNFNNLVTSQHKSRMSPKCYRVKPSEFGYSSPGHVQQQQPPLRLTADAMDKVYRRQNSVTRNMPHVYNNRHSRSSCSSFSNNENSPFLSQTERLERNNNNESSQNNIYERIPAVTINCTGVTTREEGVTRFDDDEDEHFVDSDPESYLSHSTSDECGDLKESNEFTQKLSQ